MNDDVRITLILSLSLIVILALIIGGVTGFRWLKQQDTREVTNFSITVVAPPGFECYVQENDHKTANFVLNCTKE